MQPRMFQSGKHGGNTGGTVNVPHIEMYLSCAQCPPPFLSLFISLCSSVSLTLSHIVAPLCSFAPSPFRMQRRGPGEGLPLALQLNREDGVIRALPGGCQLVLGRADRVAGRRMRVDARLPAPSLRGHLLCVEKLWSLSVVAS